MNRKKFGFTLVELLVVVSLIALLAMLIIPSFRGVTSRANTVKCANRLKRIGQAVEGRLAAGNGAERLDSYGWPGELTEYLGADGSLILECPAADGIPEGGGVHKPLNEFANIAYHPGHTGRIMEFVESGRMAKASKSQHDRHGGDMRAHWASGEGYKDDGSGVIYWGYEDQRVGGDDYQDVFVKETLTPDGRSELVCQSETSGKPCIWDKKKNVALAHYNEINRWYAVPRYSPTSKTVYIESGSGLGSNYAMNVHTIGKDKIGKILAMDYIWTLARSTDNWYDASNFDKDDDGVIDFARHNGRLNVLFPGGEVKSKSPAEIDPSNIVNEMGYWLP
ncbi:MAG: prepilin-type N-terminal cleavage/methylation domain-containing protein [Phycisphaerae bacterium]|jgi:prepilin-type N-terminal cleavage/methylation domain-containing protein|nr:prepilin-type N-terminal cleavage/methylation domain-containing protein [Phycisphaerae bacterium]